MKMRIKSEMRNEPGEGIRVEEEVTITNLLLIFNHCEPNVIINTHIWKAAFQTNKQATF